MIHNNDSFYKDIEYNGQKYFLQLIPFAEDYFSISAEKSGILVISNQSPKLPREGSHYRDYKLTQEDVNERLKEKIEESISDYCKWADEGWPGSVTRIEMEIYQMGFVRK
jgi:hypothetical protein